MTKTDKFTGILDNMHVNERVDKQQVMEEIWGKENVIYRNVFDTTFYHAKKKLPHKVFRGGKNDEIIRTV